MRNEKQKETTDEYRARWADIFRPKEKSDEKRDG